MNLSKKTRSYEVATQRKRKCSFHQASSFLLSASQRLCGEFPLFFSSLLGPGGALQSRSRHVRRHTPYYQRQVVVEPVRSKRGSAVEVKRLQSEQRKEDQDNGESDRTEIFQMRLFVRIDSRQRPHES